MSLEDRARRKEEVRMRQCTRSQEKIQKVRRGGVLEVARVVACPSLVGLVSLPLLYASDTTCLPNEPAASMMRPAPVTTIIE